MAQPLSVATVPLRVLSTTVPAGSPLVGRRVGDLHRERTMHVVSLGGRWRPWDGVEVAAGDAISVVTTRDTADSLLARPARPAAGVD
jgi:hypothetical protein